MRSLLLLGSLSVIACGVITTEVAPSASDGSSNDDLSEGSGLASPVVSVAAIGPGALALRWPAIEGAERYSVTRLPDGGVLADALPATAGELTFTVRPPLHLAPSLRYVVRACREAACARSHEVVLPSEALTSAIAYVKASNPDAGDYFGRAVALSGDGLYLAVGAFNEDSNAQGIGGAQTDNSAAIAGAVYIYMLVDGRWQQQAYLKGSNTVAGDRFGISVALDRTGSTLAVGATGVPALTGALPNAGATYLFERTGTTWREHAIVRAPVIEGGDFFGEAVSLGGGGQLLAVGARGDDSAATTVNGSEIDNTAAAAGAVHLFMRNAATGAWTRGAYLKASNAEAGDMFGYALAVAPTGTHVVVGAVFEDSAGLPTDNSLSGAGAAYVFAGAGGWRQVAYLKPAHPAAGARFGEAVDIALDGRTVVVGAPWEGSNARGIGGDQTLTAAPKSGAAFVYVGNGASYTQDTYLKAANADSNDLFGVAVGITDDGNGVLIGAPGEASAAVGLDGDVTNNSATLAGAAYYLVRGTQGFVQRAYLKAPNSNPNDRFGNGLTLTATGSRLVIAADQEASKQGSTPADNSALYAGAAYAY